MKNRNISKIAIVSRLMITAFITILSGLYQIVETSNLLGNIVAGVFCILGGIYTVHVAKDIWENMKCINSEYKKKARKNPRKDINMKVWKDAQGDDLPEIDREVIALLDNGKVVYAHRPSEHWDGKNIDTGKVTRNYPKTYGKGEWNIPNIKWWLDLKLPYE
jgi:hypothetical protein